MKVRQKQVVDSLMRALLDAYPAARMPTPNTRGAMRVGVGEGTYCLPRV